MTISLPARNPKISCIQWRMEALANIDDFFQKIEQGVIQQAGYGSDLVIFPEFFSLGLMDQTFPATQAMGTLAQYSAAIVDTCARLARTHHINILAGSLPVIENDLLFNQATFCHRDRRPHNTQYKLHPTPYEKNEWQMSGGNTLAAFDTDMGKCGILICYDVEFPELARLLGEQGMDMLLVPFWTDSINAYNRVRYCAQARAIENECYVAIAGSVGSVSGNDVIDFQHAQSAVFSPSDLPFPENAVLIEARANDETFVIAELELEKLHYLRHSGSVQIGKDRRRDLYQTQWLGKPWIGEK